MDLVSAAPSRKVVRMSIGTLKNLAITENDNSLTGNSLFISIYYSCFYDIFILFSFIIYGTIE